MHLISLDSLGHLRLERWFQTWFTVLFIVENLLVWRDAFLPPDLVCNWHLLLLPWQNPQNWMAESGWKKSLRGWKHKQVLSFLNECYWRYVRIIGVQNVQPDCYTDISSQLGENQQKKNPSVLSCSPHDSKIMAFGCKGGLLCIVDTRCKDHSSLTPAVLIVLIYFLFIHSSRCRNNLPQDNQLTSHDSNFHRLDLYPKSKPSAFL